ncbi:MULTISPECIES: DUF1345 domain-containing protein [unclassified Acinetobacter]|uniref:DUF1345 domain-containing protein n=1 Tax=unclassified Acinetobacter TaxID=196816 RepID=UPI0035B7E1DB
MNYLFRFFITRPRLCIGILSSFISFAILKFTFPYLHQIILLLSAWNVGILIYLASIFYLFQQADTQKIKDVANAEDEGMPVMLFLVFLTAIVSVLAIFKALALVKIEPNLSALYLSLVSLTIVNAWFFIHTMFALHYAHQYYLSYEKDQTITIAFPDTKQPNYWDFVYFAYIIGTSAQTADIAFNHGSSRKIGLVHSILAFFFNVAILAMLINISSSIIMG